MNKASCWGSGGVELDKFPSISCIFLHHFHIMSQNFCWMLLAYVFGFFLYAKFSTSWKNRGKGKRLNCLHTFFFAHFVTLLTAGDTLQANFIWDHLGRLQTRKKSRPFELELTSLLRLSYLYLNFSPTQAHI